MYRGRALGAKYRGRYFFADFVQGRVWSVDLRTDADGEGRVEDVTEHTAELGGGRPLGTVSSFGVDAAGELYILSSFPRRHSESAAGRRVVERRAERIDPAADCVKR